MKLTAAQLYRMRRDSMKSLAELKAIRDRMQGEVNMREDDNSHHIRVVVGMATCGIASGARPVLNKLAEKMFRQASGQCYCYTDRLYWIMSV